MAWLKTPPIKGQPSFEERLGLWRMLTFLVGQAAARPSVCPQRGPCILLPGNWGPWLP